MSNSYKSGVSKSSANTSSSKSGVSKSSANTSSSKSGVSKSSFCRDIKNCPVNGNCDGSDEHDEIFADERDFADDIKKEKIEKLKQPKEEKQSNMSKSNKTSNKSQPNIKGLQKAITEMVSSFLKKELGDKAEKIMEKFQGNKVQEKLTEVIIANPPKKLVDPNAPKRPITAYFLFCADKREKVKAENPDKKLADISKILGSLWKNLDDKGKSKYQKKFEKAKVEYENEMKNYERPSEDELAELPENNKKTRSPTKVRKPKDPNAIKRPRSAFIYFSSDKRKEVKEANEDLKPKEVSVKLGEMWREVSDKDKKKYVKMAEKDKERYEAEKKLSGSIKKKLDEMSGQSDDEEKPKKKEHKSKKSVEVSMNQPRKSKQDDDSDLDLDEE